MCAAHDVDVASDHDIDHDDHDAASDDDDVASDHDDAASDHDDAASASDDVASDVGGQGTERRRVVHTWRTGVDRLVGDQRHG